jgi:hypothetical protein
VLKPEKQKTRDWKAHGLVSRLPDTDEAVRVTAAFRVNTWLSVFSDSGFSFVCSSHSSVRLLVGSSVHHRWQVVQSIISIALLIPTGRMLSSFGVF